MKSLIFSRGRLKIHFLVHFLQILYTFVHWRHDQIISIVFVILWLVLVTISRTFRCLGSFVNLMSLMFYVSILLFSCSASFYVSWCDHRLTTDVVFPFNWGELKVTSLEQVRIFWSLSYGCCCQSILVPKLWWNKNEWKAN